MKLATRAYSILEIKSAVDDTRTLEGIATTPTTDRMGDVVETAGVQFKLPLPLLYQHNSRQPIGTVTSAKVTKSGIQIQAKLADKGIAPFIDEAWALIKAGLIRGLSIGFRTLEESFDRERGGFNILRSEWLELSAVTIPANADATITSVKSFDSEALAASGRTRNGSQSDTTKTYPGVSGNHRGNEVKTILEKIQDAEAELKIKRLRMDEIVDSDDAEEQAEYSTLTKEADTMADRITALRSHAKAIGSAVTVKAATQDEGSRSRSTRETRETVEVKTALPKGHAMARQVICLVNAQGNPYVAADLAKKYYKDSPEVELSIKATIAAGDTTTSGFASQLVPAAGNLQNDFIELLRPATLIGKIPGLKRVPFNVSIPLETVGSTFTWVGESAPKPVSAMTFDSVTLRWAKAAGIVVITKELAKFSSPSAEAIIKDSMVQQCTKFLDEQFITDTVAEVSNVSPGSILNGKSAAASTGGTTAGDFIYDLSVAMGAFVTSGNNPADAVILLSATNAYNLSIMRNSLSSSLEFPNLTINGGNIGGIPVVVSQSVGTRLVVVKASEILLADDGGMEISVSDQASVEMSSTPIAGEASPITGAILQSFWQRNLIGIRVERFVTWKRARASSVEWISGATYAPANP